MLQHLDPVTLEPRLLTEYSSILPELDGPLVAAHPGFIDGELYNYNLSLGLRNSELRCFRPFVSHLF
jgi:hypothetical protein